MTVSSVSRGRPRAPYDARKRTAVRDQRLLVVEIPWERKSPLERRDTETDRRQLQELPEAPAFVLPADD